jgi:hypothetical protein
MVDSARAGQCDDTRAASRDNGQTRIVSTDGIPLRERFSYWREVVCNATAGLFGTPTEASPGVFSARAVFRSRGPFRFMVGEATTNYRIARTQRDVANTPSDHYAIYLQLSGETVSFRGEEVIQLDAGDIGLRTPAVPGRAWRTMRDRDGAARNDGTAGAMAAWPSTSQACLERAICQSPETSHAGVRR